MGKSDKIDKALLKGKLNLYSAQVNGLTGDVYILAEKMDDAFNIFIKDYKSEPKSIKLVQDKIQIIGVK